MNAPWTCTSAAWRKALIRGNERDPIRTVRSAGYVFGDA